MYVRSLTKPELDILDLVINMGEYEVLDVSSHPECDKIIEICKELVTTGLLRDVYNVELELLVRDKESEILTKIRTHKTPEIFKEDIFNSKNFWAESEEIPQPKATQEYINLILDKIEDNSLGIEPTDDIPY